MGVISCDSQSCFREVETVGEQTFWNVPNRVDSLDSLVGIDFKSSRKWQYGMEIHIPLLSSYRKYQSQERVTNRSPCLSATNLEDPTTQLAFSFHNFLCNKQLLTSWFYIHCHCGHHTQVVLRNQTNGRWEIATVVSRQLINYLMNPRCALRHHGQACRCLDHQQLHKDGHVFGPFQV